MAKTDGGIELIGVEEPKASKEEVDAEGWYRIETPAGMTFVAKVYLPTMTELREQTEQLKQELGADEVDESDVPDPEDFTIEACMQTGRPILVEQLIVSVTERRANQVVVGARDITTMPFGDLLLFPIKFNPRNIAFYSEVNTESQVWQTIRDQILGETVIEIPQIDPSKISELKSK